MVDAYEYMISQFAAGAGKKAGEFYTPQEVSRILAEIVTLGHNRLSIAHGFQSVEGDGGAGRVRRRGDHHRFGAIRDRKSVV